MHRKFKYKRRWNLYRWHSWRSRTFLLYFKKLGKNGKLIGIDRDSDALEAASKRLSEFKNVTYVHDNHDNIKNILSELNIDGVDGILLDLGVSSFQLDEASRGFSYMSDAPLDMRMNREDSLTAYDVVNSYSKEKLESIFRNYGEERYSSRIASGIVEARKEKNIETTLQLVEVIKSNMPKKHYLKSNIQQKEFSKQLELK